ncbi:MAG: DMT family transporter [Hyphomicrobiaceae bacterium]|nr:DMT family transporter [Hyphomicrobiaceae bacterium]
MARSRGVGIGLALLCLLILGAMPILAANRPARFEGLTFAIAITFWQLVAAMPLFALEMKRDGWRLPQLVGRGSAGLITLATGAMFGLSTYMYVVAADKAGPVSMVIALQAYPLFATAWETLFLGKRKSRLELFFMAVMLLALVYLTTEGTFRISDISWWSAFALGIPLIWSIAHLLLRHVLTTTAITPNQVTISRLVISGAFLLLLVLVIETPGALVEAFAAADFQKAAFILGVAYYLELILWFYAMRHIDVSLASSVTVPAPAVTMLLTVLFLGGGVAAYQVAAMAVIAIGMYGLLFAGRRYVA